MEGYQMNFNQDFTSISVLSSTGFRLFSIVGAEKIDEIYAKDNEQIRLVERLFNSSLVVLVTEQKPNCLKMLHFKKKQDICNCVYPSEILCVRMNRHRLVVCLAESIHIHDIRDMKILHSIENIAPNELGLCTLSLNSHLAFPICTTSGELRIFNANKLKQGLTIKAHDSALSALCFSPNGTLLATASERGTVIRVFCVKNGQRVQEFRRGVKRCVRIASLIFSTNGDFLCASSNTETVHIFKIDAKAVEVAERKPTIGVESDASSTTATTTTAAVTTATNTATTNEKPSKKGNGANSPAKSNASSAESTELNATTDAAASSSSSGGGWSGYLSKAVSSYLIPSQVCDVLSQDRAFATAILGQPGLKHVCGLARVQKELKLLIACEDGFLYVHEFNPDKGGQCKLLHVHDLRYALEGVIELNLTDSMDRLSVQNSSCTAATTAPNTARNTKAPATLPTSCSKQAKDAMKAGASSVIIENPEPMPDKSYAGILKGDKSSLTDSAKYRKLCDAIDTPSKLFDERQFPPVAIAAKD